MANDLKKIDTFIDLVATETKLLAEGNEGKEIEVTLRVGGEIKTRATFSSHTGIEVAHGPHQIRKETDFC